MNDLIKIAIKEIIEREVDIRLPVYIQDGNFYYLVKGNEYGQTIVVYIGDPHSIYCTSYESAFNTGSDWNEISKEEFEKAFDKVIKGFTEEIK